MTLKNAHHHLCVPKELNSPCTPSASKTTSQLIMSSCYKAAFVPRMCFCRCPTTARAAADTAHSWRHLEIWGVVGRDTTDAPQQKRTVLQNEGLSHPLMLTVCKLCKNWRTQTLQFQACGRPHAAPPVPVWVAEHLPLFSSNWALQRPPTSKLLQDTDLVATATCRDGWANIKEVSWTPGSSGQAESFSCCQGQDTNCTLRNDTSYGNERGLKK